jgi:hypothetical protein
MAEQTQRESVALNLTFLVKRVAGECSGLCLELDIASSGATEGEAIESLKGLVEMYVVDCLEEGVTEVPLRPVPPEALREFLRPPDERTELTLTSVSYPFHHALAA